MGVGKEKSMEQLESEKIAQINKRMRRLMDEQQQVESRFDEAVRKRDAAVAAASEETEHVKSLSERCAIYKKTWFWLCCRLVIILIGFLVVLGDAEITIPAGQEGTQTAIMQTGFGAAPIPVLLADTPPSVIRLFGGNMFCFAIAVAIVPRIGRFNARWVAARCVAVLLLVSQCISMAVSSNQAAAVGMLPEQLDILGSALSHRMCIVISLAAIVWVGLSLRQRGLANQLDQAHDRCEEASQQALAAGIVVVKEQRTLKDIEAKLDEGHGDLADINERHSKARQALASDERVICGLTALRAHLDRIERLCATKGPVVSAYDPIALVGHAGTGKTWSRFYIACRYYLAGLIPTRETLTFEFADCSASWFDADYIASACEEKSASVVWIDCAEYVPADQKADERAAGANRAALQTAREAIRILRDKLPGVLIVIECRTECANEIFEGLSDVKGPTVRVKNRFECEDLSSPDLLHLLKIVAGEQKIVLNQPAQEAMIAGFDAVHRVKGTGFTGAHVLAQLVDDLLESAIDLGADMLPDGRRIVTEEAVRDALANEEWGQACVDDAERKQVRDAAMAELNGLIGLGSVKETLSNFETTLQFERALAAANGGAVSQAEARKPSFAFLGPAGTGKTTVARLMARLLYGIGICDADKLVITNPNDLIAGYIGQSGPNTRIKLEEARGGVLFVDEAYNLQTREHSNASGDFADAVIAELLTAMTSEESNVVLVFAGYEDNMQKFFDSNEGIRSRITNEVHFESYTPEELAQIVEGKLAKMSLEVAPACHDVLVRLMAHIATLGESYANARGAEKVAGEIKDEKARQWQLDQHGVDVRKIGPGVIETVLQAHLDGEPE